MLGCPNCGATDDHLFLKARYSGDGLAQEPTQEQIFEEFLKCDQCGAAVTFGELNMLYEDEF